MQDRLIIQKCISQYDTLSLHYSTQVVFYMHTDIKIINAMSFGHVYFYVIYFFWGGGAFIGLDSRKRGERVTGLGAVCMTSN